MNSLKPEAFLAVSLIVVPRILPVLTMFFSFPFSGEEDSPLSTPNVNRHHTFTERDALAMEAASRAMEEATRKMEAASRAAARENSRERERVDEGPERKRLAISEEDRLLVHAGMPSAHLKITSRSK